MVNPINPLKSQMKNGISNDFTANLLERYLLGYNNKLNGTD